LKSLTECIDKTINKGYSDDERASYEVCMSRLAFENRVQSLRDKFESLGIDTVWIIQPENRRYLSGFRAVDGQLAESSGSLLISLDHTLLLTDSRYSTQAEQEAAGFDVMTYKDGVVNALLVAFDRLHTRRLGFEAGYLVWELQHKVQEKASRHSPPIELIPLFAVVEGMREIKEERELEAISESAKLMGEVLNEVIDELKVHQVEKDVAWGIETKIREHGCDGSAFPPIVASGPNGALPHAVPTARKLESGEPIILDVGAMVDGYCSDMTRTVFLGEPSAYFREIYRIVREAQLSVIDSLTPGMETTAADSIAREIITGAGFGDFFGHSLGHGIGLATHEGPAVGPVKPKLLQEGMVFTVEPGIYIPGKGGVRLEQMVTFENGRARVLTSNENFYSF
jgi:Xaa-Pro aminopeptidase